MSIEVSIYAGDNDMRDFLATFDPGGNCTDHDTQQRAYDLYNAAVEDAIQNAIPGCTITYREYGWEEGAVVTCGDNESITLGDMVDGILNDISNASEQPWTDALGGK